MITASFRQSSSQILNAKCNILAHLRWVYRLTLAETSLIIQSVIFILFLASVAFRMKGKYLVHVATLLVAIIGMLSFFAWWIYEIAPTFDSYLPTVLSPPLHLVNWLAHEFLGVSTLVLGIWTVSLWRLGSSEFEVRSKRIWRLTTIFWVLAYVVGLLLFITLNTNII
jgi:uncharacterized membrane protein YozB (DUF420 family)